MKKKLAAALAVMLAVSVIPGGYAFAEESQVTGESDIISETVTEQTVKTAVANEARAVADWAALKTEIEKGGTQSIELPETLEADEVITVPSGADITLTSGSTVGTIVTGKNTKMFSVSGNGRLLIDGTTGGITLQQQEKTARDAASQFVEVKASGNLEMHHVLVDGNGRAVSGNSSTEGAVAVSGGTVKLSQVTFQDCVSGIGSAVQAERSANVELIECGFYQNRTWNSNANGGVVNADNSTVTITKCTFEENGVTEPQDQNEQTMINGGGALYLRRCTATVTDTTIRNNIALTGGGIMSRDGSLKISGTTIEGNGSERSYDYWLNGQGGGLYCDGSELTIEDTDIKNNATYFLGGGIYLNDCDLTLGEDVEISGNKSACGAGILVDGSASVTLNGCQIKGNSATPKADVENQYPDYNGSGGGIFLNGSTVKIISASITGNTADKNGGGIMNYSGTADVSGGTIQGNNASEGAAVYQAGNFAVSASPLIDGEVYLATVDNSGTLYPCVITVQKEYRGSSTPILLDVQRDSLYKAGRDVAEYDASLPRPDQAEKLKYDLVPDIRYFIDNEPGNEQILELSETAGTLTIRPEDQTIYSGGTSGSDANKEFPHPIYLNTETGEKLAADTRFTVDGVVWDDTEQDYPFEVRYYDKDGNEITNDETYGDFTAKIEPAEGVDADAVIITEDGYRIQFADGTLRIRYVSSFTEASSNSMITETGIYVSGNEASKKQAMQDAEELAVKENAATAVLPDDTQILLNRNEDYVYPADADSRISLLCDELLPETPGGDNSSYEKMLSDKAEAENYEMDGYTSEYRYLDLVDANDSNAWVASTEGTDVFWPYPEGVDKDSDIRLLHFRGLHREYRMEGQGSLTEQIAASEIEEMQYEKSEQGVWFHIDKGGFSPFVLSWKDAGTGEGPGSGEGSGSEDGSGTQTPGTAESGDQNVRAAQTGDTSMIYVWGTAAVLGAVVLSGAAVCRRKRR